MEPARRPPLSVSRGGAGGRANDPHGVQRLLRISSTLYLDPRATEESTEGKSPTDSGFVFFTRSRQLVALLQQTPVRATLAQLHIGSRTWPTRDARKLLRSFIGATLELLGGFFTLPRAEFENLILVAGLCADAFQSAHRRHRALLQARAAEVEQLELDPWTWPSPETEGDADSPRGGNHVR